MPARRVLCGYLAILDVLAPLSFALARQPPYTDSSTAAMLTVFGNACITTRAHADRVRAFADAHYAKMTSPAGIKALSGDGPMAVAWIAQSQPSVVMLAIRTATQACSVYTDHADVDYLRNEFLGAFVSSIHGAHLSLGADRIADTPFGKYVGTIITGFNSAAEPMSLNLITYERPGAGYQATLQVSAFAP